MEQSSTLQQGVFLKAEAIPRIEGKDSFLLGVGEGSLDCYVVRQAPGEASEMVAFIDGETCFAYAMSELPEGSDEDNPRDAGVKPLVIITGDMDDDETGQVKILQPDGHYRRYSRWDKIDESEHPDRPNAIVQSLPQCGCGGYLGAPMVFESFIEMVAYFFVVFVAGNPGMEGEACAIA